VGLLGICGFVVLLGWSFRDAAFFTVITLSTIGFDKNRSLGPGGEIFTVVLIVLGLIAVFSILAATTELITSGELERSVRRNRMKRQIDGLYAHYIVCGYGRVGRSAAEEFRREGAKVLVIDQKEEYAQELEQLGIPYLIADASREATLIQAGILRARGLVCGLDTNERNVYITLSARALREDLQIVARASDSESIDRLSRAGANRVIQPYAISGRMLASLSMRPAVIDFLDMVSITPDLRLEELEIPEGGVLMNMRVGDVSHAYPGANVLAVKSDAGPSPMMHTAPREDHVLGAGDIIVVLGPVAAVNAMAR